MAGYKKQHTDGPNSEDKALDLFAEMMIEKIESIRKDWRKPWFTEGALQWPRNLDAGTISIIGDLLSGSIFADIHLNRHSLPVCVRNHHSKRENQKRFPFLFVRIDALRPMTPHTVTLHFIISIVF